MVFADNFLLLVNEEISSIEVHGWDVKKMLGYYVFAPTFPRLG